MTNPITLWQNDLLTLIREILIQYSLSDTCTYLSKITIFLEKDFFNITLFILNMFLKKIKKKITTLYLFCTV